MEIVNFLNTSKISGLEKVRHLIDIEADHIEVIVDWNESVLIEHLFELLENSGISHFLDQVEV